MNIKFIQDLFDSIRGRQDKQPQTLTNNVSAPVAVSELLHQLLNSDDEVSHINLARQVLDGFEQMDDEQKKSLFHALATEFPANSRAILEAYNRYNERHDYADLGALHDACEPPQQELLRRLNMVPGRTYDIVRMRAELLRLMGKSDTAKPLNADFLHLFSSWFNRGFLVLRRMDWNTPAAILEKLIAYEAVHQIQDWSDLRRRLDARDRRCFAFFHPATGDEPLIFVEVALTQGIPDQIGDILNGKELPNSAEQPDTAAFYGISNCQTGLRGVSFGNFLIKQVVQELKQELPQLQNFVTTSPAPGFSKWLDQQLSELSPATEEAEEAVNVAKKLKAESWINDSSQAEAMAETVKKLAAHYLVNEKRGQGPINPVARFHLGNGAKLHRINWPGDPTRQGLDQWHGLMINYLYEPDSIESNHEQFMSQHRIITSPEVAALATETAGYLEGDHTVNNNLYTHFARIMNARGKNPFIELPDREGYSYASALKMIDKLAGALIDLGVKPGDRVAVQTDKSPEAVLLYLACLRVGGVYLPLNIGYTANEVEYFLGNAEPALFVCQPAQEAAAKAVAEKTQCPQVVTLGSQCDGTLIAAAEASKNPGTVVVRDKDDLAAILYTSGTTGRSKGAMLTHENLQSNAQTLKELWEFTESDRLIHALPIFHTHGLFVACNIILSAGARMLFLPGFNTDTIFAEMPQSTVLMGVPTFYTRLLQDSRLSRESTANMRLFISGSAPLTAETHREFSAKTGHEILERYGMTETNMNTSNPYRGARIAGTVGLPLAGVEARITDRETGTTLAQGETGILEVRGPNVFKGYWQMPEKTKEEFREDGFFITGDLAKIDEQGYVHIVGRDKDLVISGGYNVYPKEVEEVIDQLDGVAESAVIGIPHPDFGEGVTAVVVAKNAATLDEKVLLDGMKDQLAKYKQPKRIFFKESLPRNTMGKVQKNLLRDQFKDTYQ